MQRNQVKYFEMWELQWWKWWSVWQLTSSDARCVEVRISFETHEKGNLLCVPGTLNGLETVCFRPSRRIATSSRETCCIPYRDKSNNILTTFVPRVSRPINAIYRYSNRVKYVLCFYFNVWRLYLCTYCRVTNLRTASNYHDHPLVRKTRVA